jgi:hypothetical protein
MAKHKEYTAMLHEARTKIRKNESKLKAAKTTRREEIERGRKVAL